MTSCKKVRLLALKYAKLEPFKVKRHKIAENLPIWPSPEFFTMALTRRILKVDQNFF